ncbi:NADH:flavin oxidoreductase NADH oxidase family protein [Aspergillus desertorum]
MTTITTTSSNGSPPLTKTMKLPIDPAASKLFEPLRVGNMELKHRIVFPPLTRKRNDDDHTLLPFTVKYYADRASAPETLVISEATAVRISKRAKITPRVLSGSYYFQQIWGMGRASYPEFMAKKGLKYRSSDAVAMEGVHTIPEEMTEEEILEIIQSFVDTAKRVIAAGGDGRVDKWGGSTENRARLVLEVVKAVVDAVGADRVELRLSPYAAFQQAEKGDIYGQYLSIIKQLKEMAAPLAYLSLGEATGDPGALIFGGKTVNQGKTLDFILDAWDNWSPVIMAGGYCPETAAWALEGHYKKWNTLVAFGRHFLAKVFRIRHGIELNKYDRPTFYLAKNEIGYDDYPFSEGYLAAARGGP